METIAIVLVISASLCITFGYLRFITDKKGNINLNNYRLTSSIGLAVSGLLAGTQDLLSRNKSKDAVSALVIYFGLILFWIGFSI